MPWTACQPEKAGGKRLQALSYTGRKKSTPSSVRRELVTPLKFESHYHYGQWGSDAHGSLSEHAKSSSKYTSQSNAQEPLGSRRAQKMGITRLGASWSKGKPRGFTTLDDQLVVKALKVVLMKT